MSANEDTSRDDSSEWIDVVGSEQLFKKVIKKGTPIHPDDLPDKNAGFDHQNIQDGQLVTINLTSWIDSRKDEGPVEKWREKRFPIGLHMVMEALEFCVKLMELGEVAQVWTRPRFGYGGHGLPPKIPPNSTLLIEVELIRVEPPVDFSVLAQSQRLDIVSERRQRGNHFFKLGNYQLAIAVYERLLKDLDVDSSTDSESDCADAENAKSLDHKEEKLAIWNNLSATYFKIGNSPKSVHYAALVTRHDASNSKAHYRLGLALQALGRYPESLEALSSAQLLEPGSKAIHSALFSVKAKLDAQHVQEKKLAKKMFQPTKFDQKIGERKTGQRFRPKNFEFKKLKRWLFLIPPVLIIFVAMMSKLVYF